MLLSLSSSRGRKGIHRVATLRKDSFHQICLLHSLTSLNLTNFKTSKVENMYQMFYYAFAGTKQINNLKIDFSYSEFDDKTLGIDSMVNMQEMFSYF